MSKRSTVITRVRRLKGIATVGLAGVVLAACSDEKQDVFSPEGDKARSINDLQMIAFPLAGLVGVGVAVGLAYVIFAGRKRAKNDDIDPVQLEGNFKLEIGWTLAPAVLLAFLSVLTVNTLLKLDDVNAAPAADLSEMKITVYGQQWWWSYEYDLDGDGEPEIITANDLVIPAGTDIDLDIKSRDVIHSFWIPSLNGTRDAVPGRTHSLVLQADEPGEFDGQCKEFCGLSHANMKMRVVALSQADFATWLEQQQQDAPMLEPGDEGYEGQQVFLASCTSCHQIDGLTDADGNPIEVEGNAALVSGHAPNLTHLMTREAFAGALFDLYDPETGAFNRNGLEEWIRNPPDEKPMYSVAEEGELPRGMPDLGLSEEEIDDVVEYLETLGPLPASPAGPAPVLTSEVAPTDEAGN